MITFALKFSTYHAPSENDVSTSLEVHMANRRIHIKRFGAITVYNEDADPIQIGRLWRDGTAALLFIRHFG